ncbi:tetratricopeptide repeat protein [Anaerocolumna sp. AGMB13020]|uniref:tetratricopeptide repeat protein n=1 Tax=Anaerocolumna sp. AGMB13020 TaxID=3081750 RepID=UPI002954BFA8|nr:tetratricopeptide repeat protein [Anaerocolumna sp. AGMB13020]WOO38451.1 tetratricopeptide repeat protein [Anaerocolumna sp. AGMB13020]
MICPVCNKSVQGKNNRCERCGEDLTVYAKINLMSNRYYNEGLQKAKVRDLSGAVIILKKSLELNKRNTDARNLLGLIYYEMGEPVAALSQWVISKHLQQENNDADRYMELVQANPTRLENLNQTTKKYNAALQSAKQGNEDLAIIQLKKVVNLNPHFVKALQLLALLYIKSGELDKALKNLTKASKIDVSNTTTLKYMRELNELNQTAGEDTRIEKKEERKVVAEPVVFGHTPYKEERPNIWPFVNLIIGIAIGIMGAAFLLVPTVVNNYESKSYALKTEHSAQINELEQKYDTAVKAKDELDTQIAALNKQIEELNGNQVDDTIYDQLFKTAALYVNELQKGTSQINYVTVAEQLAKVNTDKLEKPQALELYNQIKDAVGEKAAAALYNEGYGLYSNRKYDEALEVLLQTYELDNTNADALYFIARSYHQKSDYENAKKYYNLIIEKIPETNRRYNQAQEKLQTLP